ncbi:MAG: ATP-binding protein [Prevotellaceae bacterium]|jgi:predicted AAA+ superfamily ATPase|nr:ATP-binding protein [Prevotellaceae bacterium]
MSKNRYFFRKNDVDLLAWSKAEDHKVLLLRGARQVGKSSAVRQLAKSFEYFLEVDFESDKETRTFFEGGSLAPQPIVEQLSIKYGVPIIAGKTLLFFDEIQACIPAISSLRYFYEKMPDLHVIAAGSLLEFALEEIPSFGVGRITSMFMYPFSFYEFLGALGENLLLEAIRKASAASPLHEVIHSKAVALLKRFLVVGGMPEVVAKYVKTGDLLQSQAVLSSLIVSLKSDFAKYRKRAPLTRLNEVFESVARQAEGKFVYEKAAMQASNAQVKQALEMLVMAGLVVPVTHTAANGVPLGAEANPKFQRMFLLDTGLFQRVLGLDVSQIFTSNDFKAINRGALAEIFVGLELLKNSSCYSPIALYYWQREKPQGSAQVDFLIQKGEKIVPIEVKAGTQGAMQSLRWFMKEKNVAKGARASLENFAHYEDIDVYPMYAISNLIKSDE